MLKDIEDKQQCAELVILDNLVPTNHLVRKIDNILDYETIYERFRPYYCENNGRPAIDPVVLFKIFLLGFMFGVRSERQLIREIEVNLAYKWFLGFSITDKVPHHSSLSKNRIHRFKDNSLFRDIFDETVFIAIQKKLVSGKELYTDSTHLKANANKKKFDKKEVEQLTQGYIKDLEKDVDIDREAHGKKKLKEKEDKVVTKETRVSRTDPDSGFLMRKGKEETFAYLDHRTVDGKFNVITDVFITKGNYHDSTCYIDRLDYQIDKFNFNVEAVGLDAGYFTAPLCHQLVGRDIFGVIGYKAPGGKKGFFRKHKFIYDDERDIYICPKGEKLKYKTTARNGYREYVSSSEICSNCEFLSKCTENKNKCKSIFRHIWENDRDKINSNRLTDEGKEIYKRRKETVERSFADAKQLHGYRYARYRGIVGVEFQALMTAICQNLKKIGTFMTKEENISKLPFYSLIFYWIEALFVKKKVLIA